MMSVITLTGDGLTVDKVYEIAVNHASVEISPEADKRLTDSRELVYALADEGIPIYGFTTGVGWNKDHAISKEFFGEFNKKLIYSHTLGVAPYASEAEVRAAMLVRLNCLLQGHTGIQPLVAHRYADFLNLGITPLVPERGSIGEGDITVLSHIGLAMIGEGDALYKGQVISSAEAHKLAGIEPVVLGPKDGLAIVSTNAFAAGQAALVLKDLKDLADIGDLVYGMSLEGLDGNTSPLNPLGLAPRRLEGQQVSAQNVLKSIEGSYIFDLNPEKPVHDPLCYRGGAHINGSLRDAIKYAEQYLEVQMNTTDDNPCVLIDERCMLGVSNFEVTTLATAFELLALVMVHVSHMSCYRQMKLSDPNLTHLSRFLSHDGGDSHCFGAFQKVFTSLDTEIRHLSNPCSGDYMPVAGDIEDHANNTPYVVQKLRKIVDDMRYIYGTELIHAAQAIDLRKQNGTVKFGKGTEMIWNAFRENVAFYRNERPISPDIQKAYEFVRDGKILQIKHALEKA